MLSRCQCSFLHQGLDQNTWKVSMHPSKMLVVAANFRRRSTICKSKRHDFRSAKKLKENLDEKINSLSEHMATSQQNSTQQESKIPHSKVTTSSTEEMSTLFEKLNQCKSKPVALSLVNNYGDQFVSKSRTVPVVSDLFETKNVDLEYPDLLRKCVNLTLDISLEDINHKEIDTRSQAKGTECFRHRAGRIGASVSGAVFNCNLAQLPQSLIKTICYPHLFKVNTVWLQS